MSVSHTWLYKRCFYKHIVLIRLVVNCHWYFICNFFVLTGFNSKHSILQTWWPTKLYDERNRSHKEREGVHQIHRKEMNRNWNKNLSINIFLTLSSIAIMCAMLWKCCNMHKTCPIFHRYMYLHIQYVFACTDAHFKILMAKMILLPLYKSLLAIMEEI